MYGLRDGFYDFDKRKATFYVENMRGFEGNVVLRQSAK